MSQQAPSKTTLADELTEQVTIPSRPEALIKISDEAKKENPDFDLVANTLKADVSLMGALLQLVNSPYFGLKTQITSSHQALMLLGLPRTLMLVRAIALRDSLGENVELPRFWDTATETAQLCEQLANRFTGHDPENAYTLGLFHDCGIPILLQAYDNYRDILREANETSQPLSWLENSHYGTNHCRVGYALAKKWFLPECISQAMLLLPVTEDVIEGKVKAPAETPTLMAVLCAAKHISNHFRQPWRVHDQSDQDSISPLVLQQLQLDSEEFSDLQDQLQATLSNQSS